MSIPHDIPSAFAVLFRAVLQASWQGSLAIALVLLVRRVLGTRVPARWPHLLWFLVLARLLVPTVVLPHSPASLENIPALARPFERPRSVSQRDAFAVDPGLFPVVPPPATRSSAAEPEPRPAAMPVAPGRAWSPWIWAAEAWLVGVLLLAGWLAACVVRLRGRLSHETTPAEESILAVWRACCQRWLRQTPPPLRVADWVDSSALVGWWRPTLLIPRQSLATFSALDWEHVFAHEIAHLRWRDHWSQLLLLAAWCVHWFNPVVWLGLRRLRADRELAADEWVLRHLRGERALAYGETLFKTLAHRPARLAFQPGMVGISEDGAQMKQRLQRIAGFLPRGLYGSLAGLAALLLLGAVVLGQGVPTPSASPTPANPTPTPPAATPSVQAMASAAESFADEILTAARAGKADQVTSLLNASFSRPPKYSKETGHRMLDMLIRDRDLPTFTVLLDELAKTNYGNGWQISDELLAALVRDKRTDFLDVLLARRLDLNRLTRQIKSADPDTAGWITRHVADVTKQRADLEALAKAARDGNLPAMRGLIDAGVDVNGVAQNENTALIEAVDKNRLDAVRLLLEHGALVDKVRLPGWDYTPLCLCNSVEMAKLLKEHGANIHAKLWRRDVNILVYVAMFGKPEVVQWFLEQGLDPKMVGDNKQNLLFNLKDGQTARLLLEAGVDPNQADTSGETPICHARSAAVAQALIDYGAKVTGFKDPLLPRMIQFASGDAVEAAIKAGAEHDPEMLQDLLISAAHGDYSDTVQVLLRYGAKPNETGFWNREANLRDLPLEVCCIFGSVKTAKVLLAAGADPNGKARGVLLRTAMQNGYKDVAKLLRDAGAKGVSDLAFALATHDNAQVKKLLESAPAYTDNPAFWEDALADAARVGDVDTVRAALAKGAPVEVKEPSPGVADAYRAAAWEGQDEVLTLLLALRKNDANPDDLRHAMWGAVWNCHPYDNQRSVEHFERCVEMLLAAHAPLTGYDLGKGTSDLMTTAVFSRNPGGNPKVMEMLARFGVNPNPTAKEKDKPDKHLLDYVQEACAQGNCSAPVADTLIKLCRLVRPSDDTLKKEPTPAASPTPQASADKAEKPSAMFGRDISTTGTVSMADGTPLDSEEIVATAYSFRGTGGFMVSPQRAENGLFPLYLDEHTTRVTVAVAQKGCAVVFVGPFDAANMDQLNHLHVKLTHGYTAVVNVVDAAGHPVVGALLRPYYACPSNAELPREETTTDASGSAAIEHVGEAPLNIRVLADGFEADEATGLRLDPAKPYRWTLKKAQPRPGIVTDASTGTSIPGAVIKLAGVRGPHNETSYDPKKAPVLTTADAQGHFTLGSLRPDSRYYLFVEAPGHGGAFLRGVRLTPDELSVVLGPELFVRGKITHAPPSVIHMDKIYLQYGQAFEFEDNSSGMATATAYLQPVNGEADFTVGPFYKVSGAPVDPKMAPAPMKPQVQIYVDSWADAEFNIDDLPISDFVFDLAQKTNDRSALEPDAPAKQATTEGKAAPKGKPSSTAASLPSPPEVHSTVPTPAPKAEIIEIQATASTEDGAPLGFDEAQIHPSMTFGPSGAYGEQFFPSFDSDGTSPNGHSLMRVPFDAKDVGIAVTKEGYSAAFAGPFSPPLEEKLKGLHFTLTKGFDATVQTVDEAGRPIAGARLECRYSQPLYLDFTTMTTDADGRASLAHVGAGLLDLLVRADGYEADEADGVQLDPAKPYRWTLKKAQPLSGYVSTLEGQPVAGANIKLAAVRGPYNETHASAPHAPVWVTSDAQGRFVLTSLRPDSRYFFFVDAPGFAGKLLSGIRVAQPELKVALGPELSVRGKFLHVPATSINAYDNTFVFGYDQFFNIEGKFWTVGQQGRIKPQNGEADFVIGALYDNAVVIRAEGKETSLEAKDLPKSGLVLDLTREPISTNPLPPHSGVVTTLGAGNPGNP